MIVVSFYEHNSTRVSEEYMMIIFGLFSHICIKMNVVCTHLVIS